MLGDEQGLLKGSWDLVTRFESKVTILTITCIPTEVAITLLSLMIRRKWAEQPVLSGIKP